MHLLEKKSIKNLSITLMVIYFLHLLLMSLIKGGRWDLNEQIAFGQRLFEGVASYANGQTDLFFPSSPYFPGVGYLSYIFSALGLESVYVNEILMLITAVLIGAIYFILLQRLTLKIYPNISKTVVLSITAILFATHFKNYIGYMIEFKPDTILLVFGLLSLFLLEKENKPNFTSLLVVGLLLFLTTFFKQSFFIIYFLVYTLILFNRYFNIKEKIVILLAYSSGGLIALYLIFRIDNLYYFTIQTLGQHPMLDIKPIIYLLGISFIYNIIFCLLLLYFLYKRYNKFSLESLETKYFAFALVWFIFSSLSTVKIGGNNGNVQVGLVVFVPFVVFVLNELFKNFYNQKYFYSFVVSILFIFTLGYSLKFVKNINFYVSKVNDDFKSIQYLSQRFNSKNVFVDGNTYIVAKSSGLNILTEAETVGHFNGIPNYDMSRLKNAIDNKEYDLFFLAGDLAYYKDKGIKKKIDQNYKIHTSKYLPSHLQNKLYVKKEK